MNEFEIIFPKYVVRIKIHTSLPSESSWKLFGIMNWFWIPIGSLFTVSWHVKPIDPELDPEKEPLNAILRVKASDGLQVVGESAVHLTNFQALGAFYLKAVKAGESRLTLTIEGNAVFMGEKEIEQHIFVLEHEPSISISILSVHTSLGLATVKMRLNNIGEDTARSVKFHPYWCEWEDIPLNYQKRFDPILVYLGDLAPGDSCEFSYVYNLGAQHAFIFITICYSNPSGAEFDTYTCVPVNYTPPGAPAPLEEEYIREIPEHYEKYVAVIPPRAETMTVTILGYKHCFSISMQGVDLSVFESMLRGLMNGSSGVTVPLVLGDSLTYGTLAPLALSTPLLGLELTTGRAMEEGEARYVMQGVERLFNDLGVFNETAVCSILNVTKDDLREGRTPNDYNVTFTYEAWVNNSKILLNATQFATYNHTINNYIIENNLQREFKLRWEKLTNATRFTEPSGEEGFLTLIYHPLAVKGSGPLKSIQVRNYAGFDASYVMKVEQLS